MGWLLPPRKYRKALVDAKRFADLGNAALPQLVLARLMEDRHLTITFGRDGCRGSDTDLAAAALARGVKVQPLSWHSQRRYPPGLVLGYAARTADEIAEGVAVVGEALRGG